VRPTHSSYQETFHTVHYNKIKYFPNDLGLVIGSYYDVTDCIASRPDPTAGFCKHGHESLGPTKDCYLLTSLVTISFATKDSVPCSQSPHTELRYNVASQRGAAHFVTAGQCTTSSIDIFHHATQTASLAISLQAKLHTAIELNC
jgi:hypothetical protein